MARIAAKSAAIVANERLLKQIREDRLPTVWCPGCGHGTILRSLLIALDRLNADPDKTVLVSGIGCSGRAPSYLSYSSVHTTHGRALAFATGIKLANPELTVIVMMGDGDAAAIGGNHLIHAARRNIDLTALVMNNSIYGMTGGQYSPTTPSGDTATTAPYGNIEPSFDICRLGMASGATFVARGTAFHARELSDLLHQAITHKGFSLVEAVSQCPIYYGRQNEMKDAGKMLLWQKEHAIRPEQAAKLSLEEMGDKFLIGVLHRSDRLEYTEAYRRVIEAARLSQGKKYRKVDLYQEHREAMGSGD